MPTILSRAAAESLARIPRLLLATASLALSLCAGCRQESPTAVTRPLAADELARVGSAVISREALLAERNRASGSEPDAVLLERLIRRELLFAEARRVAFEQSPALRSAWKNLVIQRFQEHLETQAESLPPPTPAEVEAEYVRRAEHYSLPPQLRAALIQLPAPLQGTPAADLRSEALRTTQDIPDFGPLAARSLHSPSRRQGGDLGWLTRTQAGLALPREVVEALFALSRPGEISPVVSTAEGVFLLKLIAARPARRKPLEVVREQVLYELQRERRAAAEQNLYARLRAEHAVETHLQCLAELPHPGPAVAAHPPQLPRR